MATLRVEREIMGAGLLLINSYFSKSHKPDCALSKSVMPDEAIRSLTAAVQSSTKPSTAVNTRIS